MSLISHWYQEVILSISLQLKMEDGGGGEYTEGVTRTSDKLTIEVTADTPTLYYYCHNHAGMGAMREQTFLQ